MKRRVVFGIGLALTLITGLWLSGTATGEDAGKEVKEVKEYAYIKEAKCKICHSKDATGAMYKKWEASAHAKAFATLGTPEAAEFAKKAGVSGSPQEAGECLQCHVTGYGVADERRADLKMEDGVTCQACHGPGEAYNVKTVMQAIFDGETAAADVGLIIPTEETCTKCHNEKSPTFKAFDFKEMYAKIAHEYPEEMAAQNKWK